MDFLRNIDRKECIKICLDEIDACYDRIESGKLNKEQLRTCNGWVRKQKEMLKELKYRGKMRRLKKSSKTSA